MASETVLSAGRYLRPYLLQSEEVTAITTQIIAVDSAEDLTGPYILYHRSKFEQASVKTGRGSDAVIMEVECIAPTYEESIALAEAVRGALDNQPYADLRCWLIDAAEDWDGDAYIQILTFKISS